MRVIVLLVPVVTVLSDTPTTFAYVRPLTCEAATKVNKELGLFSYLQDRSGATECPILHYTTWGVE